MKPFTTTKQLADKRVLVEMQLEGLTRQGLTNLVEGNVVQTVSIPQDQDWTNAWFVQIDLSSGQVLELTAASTAVAGWEEFGSINVSVVDARLKASINAVGAGPLSWPVDRIELVRFSNSAVVVEAGIVLTSVFGEVLLSAGSLPGALSVKAPFTSGEYEPQFGEAGYDRVRISD